MSFDPNNDLKFAFYMFLALLLFIFLFFSANQLVKSPSERCDKFCSGYGKKNTAYYDNIWPIECICDPRPLLKKEPRTP